MNSFLIGARKLMISSTCLFIASNVLHSEIVDGFPEGCSDASTNQALPGHILRLGTINAGPEGLFFSFPDQNDTTNLQSVDLAENVGLIGQDPSEDLSQMVRNATPEGSFVVAQVFVADEENEPLVTCISQVIPLSSYVPSHFGRDWLWLDRDMFYERLNWKRHSHWKWKRWWRKDFDHIRRDFRRRDRDRDFRRFRRFRDRDVLRDRGDRQMIIRRDNDFRRVRDRIIDRTLESNRRADRQMIIRKDTDTNRRNIFDRVRNQVRDRFQVDKNRIGSTFQKEGSENRRMMIKKDSGATDIRKVVRRSFDQNKSVGSNSLRLIRKNINDDNKFN